MIFQQKIRLELSQAHFVLALVLVFWMPLYSSFIPFLSFIWLFVGLFTIPPNVFKLPRIRWGYILLFVLFYLLHLLSVIYSQNKSAAWFDLEVKLPLLFFPFFTVLLLAVNTKQRIDALLLSFVLGNLVASLVCLGAAFFGTQGFDPGAFLYQNLSFFKLHPSYFSLYLTFSMAILLFYFMPAPASGSPSKTLLVVFTALFMFGMVILLSSRAGILAVFMVMILKALQLIFSLQRVKAPVKVLLFLGVAVLLSYPVLTNSRVQGLFRDFNLAWEGSLPSEERLSSSHSRVYFWKSSLHLLKDHWLTGVGVGDVSATVTAQANEMLPTERPLERTYNAHNQFLESFLALGITGIMVLLALMVWPAIIAVKKKNWLLISLVLMLFINLLFESMVNRQAGVIFFTFFLPLLFGIHQRKID